MAVLERSTDMVTLPGGTFTMGSDRFYPEEGPPHPVTVDAFRIDRRPVTVARFREFVAQTGYVTVAEQAPDPADYPGADQSLLVPGSLVFRPTSGPVDTRDVRNWWHWVPGASWTAPAGPGSNVAGRHRHPVTQVAYADAAAYAEWAGKDLPTEAEWEYAARGGLAGTDYAWGEEFMPGGRVMANTWHGRFPYENLRPHGWTGTSPVGSFAADGFGLFDVCGNVWEWTSDFHATHPDATHACCAPHNPRVTAPAGDEAIPRRVIKGGSHLCAPNYCLRYRPAARQGETVDTSTSHIGFRCVQR